MVAKQVKSTVECESLKFLQKQMNYQRKHANMITKDRVVEESLRRQINSGNRYVCEKRFRKEQYECCKHTNSYFNLSNISRLRITSRCATELSGHGP